MPAGFEALAPFIEFWGVDTAAERAHCRNASDEASLLAFYNVANELLPKALDYLDQKPLQQLDESEQRLMNLVLSFAHVALAVEMLGKAEPRHAKFREVMKIQKAPADMDAAVIARA